MHKIYNAWRHARFFEPSNQRGRGQRRERRGLENASVACYKSGREFPNRNRDRKVPGADQSDYAERLRARITKHAVVFRRVHAARKPAPHAGGELQYVHRSLYLADGFRKDFSFLARKQVREFILVRI